MRGLFPGTPSRKRRARPAVETLEDRVTPSTFVPLCGVRDLDFDPTRGLLCATTTADTIPSTAGLSLNGGSLEAADVPLTHDDGAGVRDSVALGPDGGFQRLLQFDPGVAAEASGEGCVNAADATLVMNEAIGIEQPRVPAIPNVIAAIVLGGPDSLLNLPANLRARPGDTITMPVNLNLSDGLTSADLALSYDARRLEIKAAADVQRGALTHDFDVFAVNLDPQTGTIRVGVGRSAGAINGRGAGSVLRITFHVKPNAPGGNAVVNLRRASGQTTTQLNEGRLELNPAPRDEAGDALDGGVRVLGRPRPAAPLWQRLQAPERQEVPPPISDLTPFHDHEEWFWAKYLQWYWAEHKEQCADEFFPSDCAEEHFGDASLLVDVLAADADRPDGEACEPLLEVESCPKDEGLACYLDENAAEDPP